MRSSCGEAGLDVRRSDLANSRPARVCPEEDDVRAIGTTASRIRADTARNRRRILASAGRLIGERGIDVGTAIVAREAGVGVATVYRHFPTRQDLLDALYAGAFAGHQNLFAEALAHDEPWRGLEFLLRRIAILRVRSGRCGAEFSARHPERLAGYREIEERCLAELLTRAGAPTAVGDLISLLDGLAGHSDETTAQRLVGHVLRGLMIAASERSVPSPARTAGDRGP
ncbi:TetR/AcrR family transcriptional regulator [Pseudonocardia humida]|uniref:TetR/AcrR family transcriptional regulator n=1 Tax=Pseudonocardia humida TaxID=2800819 RepID=A0ABT1ACB4_9PSEU|nr:TetR/AcrR family transcriptional regulator [Pseudonocardia humida]MCO1660699.1 TetR/AcrR family transcriptional regulator [Pseudonocardia humida]